MRKKSTAQNAPDFGRFASQMSLNPLVRVRVPLKKSVITLPHKQSKRIQFIKVRIPSIG
jgi:hypothetical protein